MVQLAESFVHPHLEFQVGGSDLGEDLEGVLVILTVHVADIGAFVAAGVFGSEVVAHVKGGVGAMLKDF